MRRWTVRVVLTALAACALAFAVSALAVGTAQGTPDQPNVPVFT
jgi:hypothetical protein